MEDSDIVDLYFSRSERANKRPAASITPIWHKLRLIFCAAGRIQKK